MTLTSGGPQPPRQVRGGRSVAAVVVLSICAAVIVALVVAAAVVIRTLVDPAAAPVTAEIVLDAAHTDGSPLTGDELQSTADAIDARLDDAEFAHLDVVPRESAVVVRFTDPSVSQADLTDVIATIGNSSRVEFRMVLFAELADCANATVDPTADVSACDLDGSVLYQLGPVELDDSSIVSATPTPVDPGGGAQTDEWAVDLVFDAAGTQAFADITQQAVADQQQFAMVVDGTVISAPAVLGAITDGRPRITGAFDETDARALAGRLTLAAIGVELTVRSAELR